MSLNKTATVSIRRGTDLAGRLQFAEHVLRQDDMEQFIRALPGLTRVSQRGLQGLVPVRQGRREAVDLEMRGHARHHLFAPERFGHKIYRATVRVVEWGGRFVLPSGEARPGVRAPEVLTLTLSP
jgi:hypothetical protein